MFELFPPLYVGDVQPPIVGFPLVVGCRTDAVLPPELIGRAAAIRLFQDRYDLRLGELRLAYGNLLAKVDVLPGN